MQDWDDLWVGRSAWDFICVDAECCNSKLMCAVGVSSLLVKDQEEWLGQFGPNDTKRRSSKKECGSHLWRR